MCITQKLHLLSSSQNNKKVIQSVSADHLLRMLIAGVNTASVREWCGETDGTNERKEDEEKGSSKGGGVVEKRRHACTWETAAWREEEEEEEE